MTGKFCQILKWAPPASITASKDPSAIAIRFALFMSVSSLYPRYLPASGSSYIFGPRLGDTQHTIGGHPPGGQSRS